LGKAHAAAFGVSLPEAQAAAAPTRTIAGFGIVGLVVAGFIHLPTSNSQHVGRKIDLPLLPPIVSSDPTAKQADLKQKQPVPLNSAQIILKEAKVAVSLSQAHLAQARINLTESTAKHNKTKILSAQGRVSRKQADLALASYQLAQLQHSSASIGLQDSTAQLIAARSELSKSRCKPNSETEM
jgi:hypothetical protein